MITLPLRTDRRLERTPWVTYSLVALNLIAYLFTLDSMDEHWMGQFFLLPVAPKFEQFITYQFLHVDAMHLVTNMIFLIVFGNAVEDRIGRMSFLMFYLAGGIVAGVGECLTAPMPTIHDPAGTVVGASGAVSAVVGAYLGLFPLSRLTVNLYFASWEVSSLVLIGCHIAYNLYKHLTGGEGVAYVAHLSGYLFGFLVAVGLLFGKLLSREPMDLLAVLDHRRRREEYSRIAKDGYVAWEHLQPDAETVQAHMQQQNRRPTIDPAVRAAIQERRSAVMTHLAAHEMTEASAAYVELLDLDSAHVLSRKAQLDIANQLASEANHERAAKAYELYLNQFSVDTDWDQVALILATLYIRYLDRLHRARELLMQVKDRLNNETHRTLARKLLSELPDDAMP